MQHIQNFLWMQLGTFKYQNRDTNQVDGFAAVQWKQTRTNTIIHIWDEQTKKQLTKYKQETR